MDGDGDALLRPDAIRRDRPIGPGKKHPAPDQQEGADQDPQSELDDRIEFLLVLWHGTEDRALSLLRR